MLRVPAFLACCCFTGVVCVSLPPAPAEAKGKKRKGKGKAKAKDAEEPAEKGDGLNEQARRYDKAGKRAYVKGRYEDAVAAFEAAYGAQPVPKFLFNIGRCYEKLGDYPRAIATFQRYLAEWGRAGGGDPEDRADAETALGILRVKLAKSMAQVQVLVQPPGALLHFEPAKGGDPTEAVAPFAGWLELGRYTLVVSQEGYVEQRQAVLVQQGRPLALAYALQPEPAAEPEPPPPPPPPAGPPEEPKPDPAAAEAEEPDPWAVEPVAAAAKPKPQPTPAPRAPALAGAATWPGWLALGTGGALLTGGAVFGGLSTYSWMRRDDLQGYRVRIEEVEEEDFLARRQALVANILYGVGAAATLTGVVLLVLSGDGEEGSAGGVRVAPAPGGAVFRGSF